MRRLVLLMTLVALPATAAQAAYEEVAVTDGGTLAGVVRFAGTPPRLEPIVVHRDREICGEQQASEASWSWVRIADCVAAS